MLDVQGAGDLGSGGGIQWQRCRAGQPLSRGIDRLPWGPHQQPLPQGKHRCMVLTVKGLPCVSKGLTCRQRGSQRNMLQAFAETGVLMPCMLEHAGAGRYRGGWHAGHAGATWSGGPGLVWQQSIQGRQTLCICNPTCGYRCKPICWCCVKATKVDWILTGTHMKS